MHFFCAHRLVGQVGPDRPREPVSCHTSDCIDEISPRTGAGVRTLPKSLRHRWGLNALFLASPPPLLEMSPTPRRRRWGASHPRPRCTARQHVDRHESCSKNAAREATRPPFSAIYQLPPGSVSESQMCPSCEGAPMSSLQTQIQAQREQCCPALPHIGCCNRASEKGASKLACTISPSQLSTAVRPSSRPVEIQK